MIHGDDQGLVLPPRLAPIQAVIVPIFKNEAEKSKVMEVADRVFKELKAAGIRIKMDDRDNVSTGFKFNDWEMRGVPVRVEIGPKDVEKGSVAFARRDKPGKEGKILRLTGGSCCNRERAARRNPGGAPQARHRIPRCQHPRTQRIRRPQEDRHGWLGVRLLVRINANVKPRSRKIPKPPRATFPSNQPERRRNLHRLRQTFQTQSVFRKSVLESCHCEGALPRSNPSVESGDCFVATKHSSQ